MNETVLINEVAGNSSRKIGTLCSLELIVPVLIPVQEKSLKVLVDFDVVKQPQILLTDEGYIFVFHLRTKEDVLAMHGQKVTNLLSLSVPLPDTEGGEFFSLYGTQKIRPRTWRSMDRMIRWFSERELLAIPALLQIATPVPIEISTSTSRSPS